MATKEQIVKLLKENDKAVARALVALYNRQTQDEQYVQATTKRNGQGFSPADARMGSSMAQFYNAKKYLTARQVAYWRKPNIKGVPRIEKYAAQLVIVSNEKLATA